MKKKYKYGILSFVVSMLALTQVNASSINLSPQETSGEVRVGTDVVVNYSGLMTEVESATKQYALTTSATMPTSTQFNRAIGTDNIIDLASEGTHYLHVRYTLSNGTVLYASGGPYVVKDPKPVFEKVELIKNTNGKYTLEVKLAENNAKITEVLLGSERLSKVSADNVYRITELTIAPTTVRAVNEINKVTDQTIMREPTVNMGTYNASLSLYRGEITATATSTGSNISYEINDTIKTCGVGTCTFKVNDNGLLGVYATNGIMKSGIEYSISNIDKSEPELVLTSERDSSDQKNVRFKWNYPITQGILKCISNGQNVNHGNNTLTGNEYVVTNNIGNIKCALEGTVYGEQLVSNETYVDAVRLLIFTDTTKYTQISIKNSIEERTKNGTSYFINSGEKGSENGVVIIPKKPFN